MKRVKCIPKNGSIVRTSAKCAKVTKRMGPSYTYRHKNSKASAIHDLLQYGGWMLSILSPLLRNGERMISYGPSLVEPSLMDSRRATSHQMEPCAAVPPPRHAQGGLVGSNTPLSPKIFVEKLPLFQSDSGHDSCEKHKSTSNKNKDEHKDKNESIPSTS